jgi:chromosome segregation ATPase
MDLQQALRMIEWLDEERRRDKNTIARLEERFLQQQEMVEKLIRQQNGLENEQVSMRSQFMPASKDTEIFEQVRAEMRQLIEGIEAKRIAAERESERRNEYAREMTSRPLRELNERLDKMEHNMDDLTAARAERDRVATALSLVQQKVEDMSKKMEEPERRITFLEEQRRQDSRRVADLQAGMPDQQKLIDGIKLKVERLENLTVNNEKRILETQNTERARREELQTFTDQQLLLSQQRDQQIKELTSSIGAYDQDIKRNLERFESWAETHRQMKKIVGDFERIGERLERRINEVAEMQRLSEERFREEWNDWIKDDQRRWKQFTLTNDEAWRNHEKEMVEFRQNIDGTRDHLTPVQKSLDRLWKLEEARANLYIDGYKRLMMEFEVDSPSALLPPAAPAVSGNGDSG